MFCSIVMGRLFGNAAGGCGGDVVGTRRWALNDVIRVYIGITVLSTKLKNPDGTGGWRFEQMDMKDPKSGGIEVGAVVVGRWDVCLNPKSMLKVRGKLGMRCRTWGFEMPEDHYKLVGFVQGKNEDWAKADEMGVVLTSAVCDYQGYLCGEIKIT